MKLYRVFSRVGIESEIGDSVSHVSNNNAFDAGVVHWNAREVYDVFKVQYRPRAVAPVSRIAFCLG